MPKYKQLRIDGVLGDIWDDEAVHNDDVVDVVLDVLDSPVIRTALLNIYHPIGSYYFTDRDVNPSTFLGGSWNKVEGRVLLGASAKYPANSTGGYEDSTLPEHTHTIRGEVASAGAHTHTGYGSTTSAGNHSHSISGRFSGGNGGSYDRYVKESKRKDSTGWTDAAGAHAHDVVMTINSSGAHAHAFSATADNTGNDGTGRNMMPYIAAYIWVRYA